MSVTGMYGNDAMLRQVAESMRINQVAKGSLINTKRERNYVKLARVVLDQGETRHNLCKALHEVYELTKTLDTSCPGYLSILNPMWRNMPNEAELSAKFIAVFKAVLKDIHIIKVS